MSLNSIYGKYFLLGALAVSAAAIISCNKGSSDQGDSGHFSFDKSKQGIEIVDQELGIKFNPPKNWELRQTMVSKKIESGGSNPGDQFIYHPTYIFFNDSTGGLLSAGKVETSDTSLAKSTRLNFYKGLINSKHKNDNISAVNFVHSKLYFSQFRVEKQNLISYKLIFENTAGEIIEFDYTIPLTHLEGTQPYINASIGSIRPQ
ncbi:MAG: hypothetical protein CVV24_12170 [Ignavibacteriae bacterium HGW-Ignavibacteriae-3]|nr:MAG: hypothetical protein CVV24_12170 [Ignavibacteriae bacterium HGW-Ignavibacteriae-3]